MESLKITCHRYAKGRHVKRTARTKNVFQTIEILENVCVIANSAVIAARHFSVLARMILGIFNAIFELSTQRLPAL